MEHLWKIVVLIVLFVMIPRWLWSQETKTKLALLKYKGGGDWYANPTSLPNLIRFCNENLQTDLARVPVTVEPASLDIFNYPYIYMTGHGNVVFTETEAQNLREYLLTGGFPEVVKESFQSISRGYYESVKEKVAEVKAAAADPEVYVQYQGNESNLAVITERIKKQYVEEGHKESDIKSLKIYLKPEDASAYYVINDNNSGKVFLF